MLRVAAWEAQAQVARLDGMRRDVWQWDVPGSVGGGQGSGSSSSFGDGVECAPTELQLPQQATSGSTPSPRSTEAVEDEEASGRGPQLPASRRRLRVSHMDANRCARKLSGAGSFAATQQLYMPAMYARGRLAHGVGWFGRATGRI